MTADPILVLAFVISVGLVAARLMYIGLRNGVHDEDGSPHRPTLDTRGPDPDDSQRGTH